MAKAANWALTDAEARKCGEQTGLDTLVVLSLIHISEPTRLLSIAYAVFCLQKKTIHVAARNDTIGGYNGLMCG